MPWRGPGGVSPVVETRTRAKIVFAVGAPRRSGDTTKLLI